MKITSYFLCYSFLFLSVTSCILAQSNSYENHDSFLQCLQNQNNQNGSISEVIYTSQNASYTPILVNSTQNARFRMPFQPKPEVIVTPLNYLHVQIVVKCARANGIKVRPKGGGHDYEGLSTISYYREPYVVVDLRNLKSISVDTEAQTAWVEGGVRLGELYHTVTRLIPTLGFPSGTCPTVGVGGHIGGGGEGPLKRKYGVAADHVIDARIVDANGDILDRESMGEDLFWAIRGGGGASFGIILAYKVGLVEVPSIVTVFTVDRTLEQNATKLVHLWQTVAPALDRNLFIRVILTKRGESKNNTATVNAAFQSLYQGTSDNLLSIMRESFPELGLKKEDCREMTWIESALYFSDLPSGSTVDDLPRPNPYPIEYYKAKSDYVTDPIPESGLEGIWKLFMDEYAERGQMIFAPYGGKMAEISESEIAFPHRAGNLYQIQHLVYWNEDQNANSQSYIKWIRDLYEYMTPFVSKSPRRAYLNYLDLDLGFNGRENATFSEAGKWGFKYFNNNFQRLARVKAASDPDNFFRFEVSIPRLS